MNGEPATKMGMRTAKKEWVPSNRALRGEYEEERWSWKTYFGGPLSGPR